MDDGGIPAPMYLALTGLIVAITAVIQEWLRGRREKQKEVDQVAREKAAAEKVAAKVEEVKEVLEESTAIQDAKLDSMAVTGEKTHTLVNSNMGVQLTLNKAVTRRLANLTKDPIDEEAANMASQLLTEHEKKQATVDAKEASDQKDQGNR